MAFCKTRRANVRPPCLFTSLDKAQHIIVAFVEFRALVRADFNVNKQTINIANISNSSQEYRKYKTGTASLKNAVYYPLLILSINSSDVSISILLWPNKKFKTVETWVGNSFIQVSQVLIVCIKVHWKDLRNFPNALSFYIHVTPTLNPSPRGEDFVGPRPS